ncbi:TRAP transporter substrate-binding protein DctP [Actinoplanes aureus]|uniref:TRAP transporter substrate-binding protein DctP n=1 Tax=Actinoplanes aureus TaxID=2792083 RepID=A0A931BYY2_9ACTN|nr:TRAP transporter substrate-binding protein DctP [Actinoplanes aureus]MBG0560120.1 TRAP transporter substrate-binding protein DctP [Actinoplanes aureus]
MWAVVGAAGAGLATGCNRSPSATTETLDVLLGESVQPTSPMVAAEKFFAERVAELTEGQCRVTVKPGGELGDEQRMAEMLRTGKLAFCKTLLANLTAYDKRLGVASLPYAFNGRDQCLDSMRGDFGRRCSAILAEHGLVMLGFFYAGDRNFYNRERAIHTPADLKGLRIRVPQSIVSIDMINALGATAVPLATNDVGSALKQGLVDGAENSVIFYMTEQHLLHAPYLSWTRHQHGVDVLLASAKWLSERPATMRDAIMEAGRLAQEEEIRLWVAATEEKTALAQQQGSRLNEVDVAAFRRALAKVISSHRSTFGDLAALLPDAD